jgi:HD-like signal output (HDOD) protein
MLPTIPTVAQDVLMLTENDTTSLSSLVSVVEKDPAISLRIISVANSAFFGFGLPAQSLMEAIARIGFDHVRYLALGVSLMTLFNDGKNNDALSYEIVFSHSIAVGLTAKLLLKRLNTKHDDDNKIEPDVLLMNGILHDIGYLVLNRFFPDEFNQVITHAHEGTPVLAAEEMVFDFTHCDIGSWLAEEWKLPESIALTTMHHHAPSLFQNSASYAAIVHLADYLVDSCGKEVIKSETGYMFDPACYDIFNLKEDDMSELIDLMQHEDIIHGLS